VFEDAWFVLRTAIEEIRGAGPRESLLEFYLESLEQLFCLVPRCVCVCVCVCVCI
jgi:hypothetical protein